MLNWKKVTMMITLHKENLRVITFDAFASNSIGTAVPGTRRTHNLVFNITRISEEEVNKLIEDDMWDIDSRVIDIPTSYLNNLMDLAE